ncbi:hypothetical protein CORC01_06621 [Colletotrichum orchidophilum]|uniref:Uncharacterized protein n=1 Tax=Colletotrichum orchidophilum TaxID=1209926 RepID=A0A1G4B9L3_9PEZI|nr:uncharacterized protein CORC01_06621 [Colletotrichum orchidophilum]OHE98107.1 hypothetical protein CORC01_06621 [Colletotrichum orchidophilum]
MARISLYSALVPQFRNGLVALSRILAKAAEHYDNERHGDITKATLIEGMLPLPGHVLLVSNRFWSTRKIALLNGDPRFHIQFLGEVVTRDNTTHDSLS